MVRVGAVCDRIFQLRAPHSGHETEAYTPVPDTNGRISRGKFTIRLGVGLDSDSFTILDFWVLGLAVSHIN